MEHFLPYPKFIYKISSVCNILPILTLSKWSHSFEAFLVQMAGTELFIPN